MTQIYIIDDDPICNFLSENSIRKAEPGIALHIFTNPVQAVSVLNGLPFDPNIIILLDLNMPEISGWEVIDRLVHQYHIYILSSSISPIDKAKCSEYNVNGFFSKPLTPDMGKLVLDRTNLFYNTFNGNQASY
jgi:CheY-like chemotaxis protein